MKYKVSIGRENKFHGLTRDMFEEGEEVVFYVPFVTDVNTSVTSKDVRLETLPTERSERKYSFIMPAHDVEVKISFSGGMTCMHQPQGMPMMGMMMMQNMMNMQDVPKPPVQSFGKADSKFCKECGAINNKDAKFCGSCGVRFE